MSGKKIDLGLTGYDELFMDDKSRAEAKLPRIYDIPLAEIDDFPDHPFQVRMDEDMDQLVESIKERGIITPITLRQKEDGRYELVSGHRRKKACELAGFETIKAEIRELTRDEAIILMVESNLQRSVILPSEKAFSYKMKLEAMSRQGQRRDLTCGPVGHKSRDVLAENGNDSARQISRYIRLYISSPIAHCCRGMKDLGSILRSWFSTCFGVVISVKLTPKEDFSSSLLGQLLQLFDKSTADSAAMSDERSLFRCCKFLQVYYT